MGLTICNFLVFDAFIIAGMSIIFMINEKVKTNPSVN